MADGDNCEYGDGDVDGSGGWCMAATMVMVTMVIMVMVVMDGDNGEDGDDVDDSSGG